MRPIDHLFTYVSGMNAQVNESSSLGQYVSATSRQLADSIFNEIIEVLPEESLARNIMASSTGRFSDKQLWVIAVELQKNDEFTKKVVDFYEQPTWAEMKKAAKKAKAVAGYKRNEAKDIVTASGKSLDDYYEFLKANFKREFYSKRYSAESANAFVNA